MNISLALMLQHILRQTRVPGIYWLGNKRQTLQLAPFKQNEHLKHKKICSKLNLTPQKHLQTSAYSLLHEY